MTALQASPRIARALTALAFVCLGGTASAHVMPLTDRQIAAGSPHVVVAVVESARPRWNDRHNLILTDYALRVENRLKGDAPDRFTLSIPGGTVDGETHSACVSTPLESGARYLLFLQDLGHPVLVPVTGGWQGAYREVPAKGKRGEFSQVVRAARELLARVEADPRPSDTAWMATAENDALPAKFYDPTPRATPPLTAALDPATAAPPKDLRYFVENPATAPLTFDPLPSDSPFSPGDRDMMALWNRYLRRPLFLVNRTPSPGWAFGNGVSEIAGFPSSQDLQDQLGHGWFSGAFSTVLTVIREGHIIEADIALNPARSWIAEPWEPLLSTFDGPLSFNPAILMDLGTAWGYQGPRSFYAEEPADRLVDSIMEPGVGDSYSVLMPADTAAVRATYGGKPIRDGAISPYSNFLTEEGFPASAHAYASVDQAAAGSAFAIVHPIKIENPGTVALRRPTVEVYLAPTRGSLTGAVLLKRLGLRGNVPPGGTRPVELGTVRIPPKTRAGVYHLVYVLRDPADAYQANNRAWTYSDVPVTVTR